MKFKPFKALSYNPEKAPLLSDVVTPPYDVLSAQDIANYRERQAYNFAHIDIVSDGDYALTQKIFENWCEDDVLIKDKGACFYIHSHCFLLENGERQERIGILASWQLSDNPYDDVKAHEQTLDGPKVDRLKLMTVTQSQFSPVFMFFADESHEVIDLINKVTEGLPWRDFVDDAGCRQRLWRIADHTLIATISHLMQEKTLYIADGHHRFATIGHYRDTLKRQGQLGSDDLANHAFIYAVPTSQKGLQIQPIHRTVSHPHFDEELFLKNLAQTFQIERLEAPNQETIIQSLIAGTQNPALGFVVVLPKTNRMFWVAPQTQSNEYNIPTEALQKMILEPYLKITPDDIKNERFVQYHKSLKNFWEDVSATHVGFILPPTTIASVCARADQNLNMPQKSTYFYPKIPSGLLIYSMSN